MSVTPPGTLYVCGTPIGNLNDVSYRLLETLNQVDAIVCEDTRRTLKLLTHFGIKKRVLSFDQHMEREKTGFLLKILLEGKSLAFVSDAGMPAVSDPGSHLVKAARQEGIRVAVVPGPSSVTAAMSISGFPGQSFVFLGFPPRKAKARQELFRQWIRPGIPVVFFEAPTRLVRTLESLAEVFPEAEVSLCHEMTKVHEEVISGPIKQVYGRVKEGPVKGEWVIVVFLPHDEAENYEETDDR